MGQVFSPIDTRLGRKVAIKVSHERFSERFGREAKAISSLNHSHFCTLYDVGPNYLLMERVDGETLAGASKKASSPSRKSRDLASRSPRRWPRPRARHHAPRSQAWKHHAFEVRRKGSGLWAGKITRR